MAFQPGLMNRALSNREMFRQVQTMPVTANDPRPRRSQELMDYVSEGTEGQWKDPDKRPSAKSLAPKSPGEQTETGKQITGALGGIGQGLAALFAEKPAAPQQERPVLPMNYVKEGTEGQFKEGELQKALQQDLRNSSEGGYIEGVPRLEQDWHGKSEGKPQKPAAGDSTWRDWSAGRSKGSRGHFDAGHA